VSVLTSHIAFITRLIAYVENWQEAQSDFFESFRNYDEAGSLQRIQVLKYLVLTTMLMGSDINPFDSPETKAYQNDPRISAMTDLVDSYQRDDMHKYEAILQKNQDLLEDQFIAENIDEVTRNMRTKGVLKLVAPYTRFTLAFIAKQLKIAVLEVQDIIGFLILDQKLKARINQTDGTVEVDRGIDVDRIQAVGQWSSAIESLWSTVLNSSDGFRAEDSAQILGGSSVLGVGDMVESAARIMNGPGEQKSPRKSKGTRKLYSGA